MTYEELCSFEVLYKAYLEARKGKRSKSKTIEYEAQALACTEKLSRKLAVCNVRQPDGSIRQQIRYVPSKFEVFAVYEPKRRMVHAPAFVDKVVLHALVDNILYDALTKSFIRDSHASQTGKGTDDGLELNQKTAIFPLRNGIDFLGFHSYLTDTGAVIQKLRRDSSKRMKNKIRYWETAYPAGEVTKQEILRSFDAWDAHAAHGDTYSLRRKYADRLEKLLDCKIPIHRKINSNKLARDRRRARQCRCIYKKQHKALSLSVSQNTRPAEIMPWA